MQNPKYNEIFMRAFELFQWIANWLWDKIHLDFYILEIHLNNIFSAKSRSSNNCLIGLSAYTLIQVSTCIYNFALCYICSSLRLVKRNYKFIEFLKRNGHTIVVIVSKLDTFQSNLLPFVGKNSLMHQV